VGPLRRRSKAGDGRRLLTAGETGEDRRWPTPARRPAPVDGGRVGPGGDCRRSGTGRRQATAVGRRRPVGRRQSTAAEWGPGATAAAAAPAEDRRRPTPARRPAPVDGGRVGATAAAAVPLEGRRRGSADAGRRWKSSVDCSPRPKVPPSAFGQRRSTEGEWGRPPPPVKGRRRPTPVCREGDCHRSVQKRQSSFLD